MSQNKTSLVFSCMMTKEEKEGGDELKEKKGTELTVGRGELIGVIDQFAIIDSSLSTVGPLLSQQPNFFKMLKENNAVPDFLHRLYVSVTNRKVKSEPVVKSEPSESVFKSVGALEERKDKDKEEVNMKDISFKDVLNVLEDTNKAQIHRQLILGDPESFFDVWRRLDEKGKQRICSSIYNVVTYMSRKKENCKKRKREEDPVINAKNLLRTCCVTDTDTTAEPEATPSELCKLLLESEKVDLNLVNEFCVAVVQSGKWNKRTCSCICSCFTK